MSGTSRWRRLPWNSRRNIGREVDEELRFHIDALADELIAQGRSERAARDEAERRFGAVGSVRDECVTIDRRRKRRLTWTEVLMMTALDFRVAVRALRRAPVYSLAIVGTLVIGIGAAAAIFTVVNAVLLRPLPYREPERLVFVGHNVTHLPEFSAVGLTPGLYYTYKAFSRSLSDIAMYSPPQSVYVASPDHGADADAEAMSVTATTGNLFSILGVRAALGRTFTPEDNVDGAPLVIVISDGFWRSRFGADPNVIGKPWLVQGRRMPIVGVMPPNFHFPDATTKFWVPLQFPETTTYTGGYSVRAVARLAPGVDIASAQRELTQVLPRVTELYPMANPEESSHKFFIETGTVPRVIPLYDYTVGNTRGILWLVAAAAGLVLLVTTTNTTNLLLVRVDARRRELSVRAALGASSGRVLAHFFAESVLLAGLAAVAALGMAWLAVSMFIHSTAVQVPRIAEVRVDASTVLFTALVSIVVAAVCNAVPATRFLHGGALAGLRDAGGGHGGTIDAARQLTRATLVTAQLSLALVALVASGLLLRSFEQARKVRPGFDAEHVATLWVGAGTKRYPTQADYVHFYAELTRAVSQIPGVTETGVTSRLPLTHPTDYVSLAGGAYDDAKLIAPLTIYGAADAGFFRTLQIPLIAGRQFAPIEAERGEVAIISQQAAAEIFGDSSGARVIGKTFHWQPGLSTYTVVGVVGSTRDTSLFAPPSRIVYVPESPKQDTSRWVTPRFMAIVARTSGDVDATIRAMRQAVHKLNPNALTTDAQPLSGLVDAQMARLAFITIILGAGAAVTLVLGLLGLYGVIAYVVTLRTREIGLRIALGATPGEVSQMVARQGLVLGVIGAIAGLGLAAATTRLMKSFLFGVSPLDPMTLVAAVIALIACALLASWVPARRAARVDPALALRAD